MSLSFRILVLLAFCSHTLLAQRESVASVRFQKADSIANRYAGHSLHNLHALAQKLTSSLSTDVEKFRALYRWTCLNIDNDYALFHRNQEMRERLANSPSELQAWNQQFGKEVFETLRKKKRTICTGYAYLLRELATHAGLECVIIDGYGRTSAANVGGPGIANHSWNGIKLNNQWYLCDATWSSGAMNTAEKRYVKEYNDAYFLADPSLFICNHYPLDTSRMLLADKPTLHTFLNRPLIYSGLYDLHITDLSPDTFAFNAQQHQLVHFQFTMPAPTASHITIIDKSSGEKTMKVKSHYVNGKLEFDYAFTSRGLHTVHVLLNDVFIATYSVTVGRGEK